MCKVGDHGGNIASKLSKKFPSAGGAILCLLSAYRLSRTEIFMGTTYLWSWTPLLWVQEAACRVLNHYYCQLVNDLAVAGKSLSLHTRLTGFPLAESNGNCNLTTPLRRNRLAHELRNLKAYKSTPSFTGIRLGNK